jgi:nucleoside-diphosphate-sugar epimerase
MFEKILLTGANGKIAKYVIEDLKGRCQLTCIDLVPGFAGSIVNVDICDLPSLTDAMRGHDAVVHLAAAHGGTRDHLLTVNVVGTWNVLAAAEELGLRKAVFMSSEAGLGMEYLDVDPPPLQLPIDENHPFRPSDVYGLSKQLCEAVGQNFARRRKLSVVGFRPTEVTFPAIIRDISSRLGTESSVGIRAVTRTWNNRGALAISRAYIRPDDMARLIRLALEADTEAYEVFWASALDTYAPQPTLEFMRELYGSLPEVRTPKLYEKYPNAAVFDMSAARHKLQWEPTSGWKQTVAELDCEDPTVI